MNIVLLDLPEIRQGLLPFTYTRPVCDIRVGILTIKEKWNRYLQSDIHVVTESYLQPMPKISGEDDLLVVNSGLCPEAGLIKELKILESGSALFSGDRLLAYKIHGSKFSTFNWEDSRKIQYTRDTTLIQKPWDIFLNNGPEIKRDFRLLTRDRKSQDIKDPYTRIYQVDNVFAEEGVQVKAAIINAENGPVYLGKNSKIQEGSIITGPFALCEGAQVNVGGKMRGDVTIGPYSKVAGEISNSVLLGYSNKGHEGFIGNSVLGEWCNLGAGTNCSNLKNNYSSVKVWDYQANDYTDSGQQFCGLLMGDHSKCGINTMFNTGTVVGVNCNIYGAGFPPKFIPSFSWGGEGSWATYLPEKAFQVADTVMRRRNKILTEEEREILQKIHESSAAYRKNMESL